MANTPFSAQEPTSIQKMFNKIAGQYDRTNSILSLGIHLLWKKKLVKQIDFFDGIKILDCATGTGDLAFMYELNAKKKNLKADITGIDFSEKMLEVAKQRAEKIQSQVKFKWADVEFLPFANQSFDVVTISFGIRNVSDTKKGLSEMSRVLKPGGTVLILEFGQPSTPVFGELYQIYSKKILPALGGMVSGEKQAYHYLNESSEKFPCGKEFIKIAEDLNLFSFHKSQELSLGIAYLYSLINK